MSIVSRYIETGQSKGIIKQENKNYSARTYDEGVIVERVTYIVARYNEHLLVVHLTHVELRFAALRSAT